MGVYSQVLDTPAAIGQQTYDLPDGFDPKIVLLIASQRNAHEDVEGAAIMSVGMGTYDGGSVQQWFESVWEGDASATSNPARGGNTTALLRGLSGGAALDYRIILVSLGSGAGSNVVLDWTTLPATATKVHMVVLGGANVSSARAGMFNGLANVAGQDVVPVAGCGHFDFLFMAGPTGVSAGLTDGTVSHAFLGFGASKGLTERAFTTIVERSGVATMDTKSWGASRAGMHWDAVTNFGAELEWDKANDPTDGFRISYPVTQMQANARLAFGYVAVKLVDPSKWKIGRGNVPASGGAGQTVDLNAGGTPEGALFWGDNQPSGAPGGSDADLAAFFLGYMRSGAEGSVGITSQDNVADSNTSRWSSDTKALRMMKWAASGAPTATSQADASISGTNVRLTFGAADTRARDFGYVLFAEAAGGPTEVPLTAAAASASASLALTAAPIVALSPAAASAGATLGVTAPTTVPLSPAAASASGAATLTAPTTVALSPAAAQAGGSLAVETVPFVPLSPAAASASGSLALTAGTRVPLAAAGASASGSLALTAPTRVPLSPADATAAGTLALRAPTQVPLAPAAASAAASAAVSVPAVVPLAAASASASGSLSIEVLPFVALAPAAAVASGSLALTTGARPGLSSANASASASLALTAAARVPLDASSATAAGELTVRVATVVPLFAAAAVASGSLAATRPEPVPLAPSNATADATLAIVLGFKEFPESPMGLVFGGSAGGISGPGAGRVLRSGGGTIS